MGKKRFLAISCSSRLPRFPNQEDPNNSTFRLLKMFLLVLRPGVWWVSPDETGVRDATDPDNTAGKILLDFWFQTIKFYSGLRYFWCKLAYHLQWGNRQEKNLSVKTKRQTSSDLSPPPSARRSTLAWVAKFLVLILRTRVSRRKFCHVMTLNNAFPGQGWGPKCHVPQMENLCLCVVWQTRFFAPFIMVVMDSCQFS